MVLIGSKRKVRKRRGVKEVDIIRESKKDIHI